MTDQHDIYFRRKRLVLVPEASGSPADPRLLASLHKNVQCLGFKFTPRLLEALTMLSEPQISRYGHMLTEMIKRALGAHVQVRLLYSNFPQQVMDADEASLYLNALRHYWTLEIPEQDAAKRPELVQFVNPRPIDLGSSEEMFSLFEQMLKTVSPYSPTDQTDVAWIIKQYPHQLTSLLPPAQSCKENLAFVGAQLMLHHPTHVAWFGGQINTVTDVLRLVVCMSGGDTSLAMPGRVGSFARKHRVQLLTWIEGCKNIAEDMLRYAERWKRVGERLHPGEYAKRFPRTLAAISAIRAGTPVPRFSRDVELLLQQADWDVLLPLLVTRPGEFARRFDVLLCRGVDPQVLLDVMGNRGVSISTAVLLQVMTHFEQRMDTSLGFDGNASTVRPLRVFFPKGQVANLFARKNDRPLLSRTTCNMVVQWCEQILVARFAKLEPLGTCYLASELDTFLVPFSQRSASKALRTLARGSHFPLPFSTTQADGLSEDTLRFFVWWKNGRTRTDIDLSATLYGTDYEYVDTLAYYRLKSYGAHHSGDIVDAPNGAAEFIDINLQNMLDRNVRYVVMSISCYSGQPYIDLPECFAGWMAREKPNSGEVFEPKTVQDKVDIASDTVFCIPAIFDLAERRAIWADIALKTQPQFSNNVANNLAGVSLMLRAITQLKKTSLHRLFGLHVQARGTRVHTEAEAQTVFSVSKGITPLDTELIGAEFLR
jgi:hypothetical protein